MTAPTLGRAARRAAGALLVQLGRALGALGRATLHPDDLPPPAEQAAISRAADALQAGAEQLVAGMRAGRLRPREAKAFHRVAMQFLDLRAVAVGDTSWLAQREQQRREHAEHREQQHIIGGHVLADIAARPHARAAAVVYGGTAHPAPYSAATREPGRDR